MSTNTDGVDNSGGTLNNADSNGVQMQMEVAYVQTALIDHALTNLQLLETLHDMVALANEKQNNAIESTITLRSLQEKIALEDIRQKELNKCEVFAGKVLTKPSRAEMESKEANTNAKV